jgi:uncharacterized coiled-coil protein SlyX
MSALLITMTACTVFRSIESSSPEDTKKSELSKNDLWNQIKTIEKEKSICQKQLADHEGVVSRMNIRLSDQQNEITRFNKQISELNFVIDDLRTKMKQIQETGEKDNSLGSIHATSAKSWGTTLYAIDKTNIRAKRSVDSKLQGFLMPGQSVKADFLKDDWYAVFKITDTVRLEKKALGYVYAPRLFKTFLPRTASEARKKGELPAVDKTAQDIFTVVVKSIRHMVLPEGKEVLLVEFNRFYVPAVYNVEGNTPMIIMDVTCTSSMKKEWSDIHTDGTLIRKIQVTLNPKTDILRIVLNMAPDKDYDIKPIFYTGTDKDSKVYTLEVMGVTPKK